MVAPAANARRTGPALDVDVSLSLLPVLMPLLAGLRRLFDLDAEPAVIDAALTRAGLAEAVRERPGLRSPGALDGFEVALSVLLADPDAGGRPLASRVVAALGDPAETAHPALDRHAPTAGAVAEAGTDALTALGVPPRQADALTSVARSVACRGLRLEPGSDPEATRFALRACGISDPDATEIIARSLAWPDVFPEDVPVAAAQVTACHPWRAYAARHLALSSPG